jgi:hypothetical protein
LSAHTLSLSLSLSRSLSLSLSLSLFIHTYEHTHSNTQEIVLPMGKIVPVERFMPDEHYFERGHVPSETDKYGKNTYIHIFMFTKTYASAHVVMVERGLNH